MGGLLLLHPYYYRQGLWQMLHHLRLEFDQRIHHGLDRGNSLLRMNIVPNKLGSTCNSQPTKKSSVFSYIMFCLHVSCSKTHINWMPFQEPKLEVPPVYRACKYGLTWYSMKLPFLNSIKFL